MSAVEVVDIRHDRSDLSYAVLVDGERRALTRRASSRTAG